MFDRRRMRRVLILVFNCLVIAPSLVGAQVIPATIDQIVDTSSVSDNNWSMLIENENGSLRYYERSPDLGLAPASNTKLFTTAAAFGLLGPDHDFESRVYLEGAFNAGTLSGNINLVVEHDITWNDSTLSNPRAGLERIAQQVRALGLTSVTGSVRVYGASFYNLGQFTDIRNTSQTSLNSTTAAEFRNALIAAGVSVSGGSAGLSGFSPPGALFYTHRSGDINTFWSGGTIPADLYGASISINRISHNPMAEMLLRAIGYQISAIDSLSAGSADVRAWLAATAGIDTSGIVMNDGSGLSHGNRFSARQTLGTIRYAFENFPTYENTLSINGVSGTLFSRVPQLPDGSVKGKTGTLSISIATSGVVINPVDGERYLFSLLANRSGISQSATRATMDEVITVMGGRGLPNAPVLQLARNDANGDSITLIWENPGEQLAFVVLEALLPGGAMIPIADVVLPVAETAYFVRTGIPAGQARFFGVVGREDDRFSKLSDVYGARADIVPSPVLIVDGNDRWQSQPAENPAAEGHDFAARVATGVDLWAFDTAANEALPGGRFAVLNDYHAALWLLGEESTADETFSDSEQSLVTSYLNVRRGNLLHSGAETGWDLVERGTASDTTFYNNVLRTNYIADLPAPLSTVVNGVGGEVFADFSGVDFDGGPLDVNFPDVIGPLNGSVRSLDYVGTEGAGVTFKTDGGPRLVNLGFPLENIANAQAQAAMTMRSLDYFFPPLAPGGLDAISAGGGVVLNWDENFERDLLGYNVYRADQSGAQGTIPINPSPLTDTNYFDIDAPAGMLSYYIVTAVDLYDLESAASNEAPAIPGNLDASLLIFD